MSPVRCAMYVSSIYWRFPIRLAKESHDSSVLVTLQCINLLYICVGYVTSPRFPFHRVTSMFCLTVVISSR